MLSQNRVHRSCAVSGRQEQEDTGKNATSFAEQWVNKAKEWDFSPMFSVDLTPSEIRSEAIVCCGAARQLSPEIFERSHPKFFNSFQLFLWEFWRTGLSALGISLCYGIGCSTIFPFFFPIFFSCYTFYFLSILYASTSLLSSFLGGSCLCFLRGFPFLSVAIPLLP